MTANQRTTTNQQPDRAPLPASDAQVKYLRYLLSRAHELGVPYLPVEALSRSAVSAWIDYLKVVLGEESGDGGAKGSSSPSLSCPCGLGGCAQRSAV